MLACRKRGSTADRLLLPEHPTRVLLLKANDLHFGAVPHLFAPHTRPPVVGVLVRRLPIRTSIPKLPVATATDGQIEKRRRIICGWSAFACQWKSASGARTGMQLVNTSANRLHCQSVPSAALVGDVDRQ